MDAAGRVIEVRSRLAAAGWTVLDVHLARAPDAPVVIVGRASRGDLRARLGWIQTFIPGSTDDLLEQTAPLGAEQRVGAAMVRAHVNDMARAREEHAALEPLFTAPTLAAAIALVAARGFKVDPRECEEGEYDEFHRYLKGRRAGEHIAIDYTYRGRKPEEGIVLSELLGGAQMHQSSFTLSVTVRVLAPAEEVVDVLTRPAAR